MIPDLHPCLSITCPWYEVCKAYGPLEAKCECDEPCHDYEAQVCGSDGVTYKNYCKYKLAVCKGSRNLTIAHNGSCFRKYVIIKVITSSQVNTNGERLNNADLRPKLLPWKMKRLFYVMFRVFDILIFSVLQSTSSKQLFLLASPVKHRYIIIIVLNPQIFSVI